MMTIHIIAMVLALFLGLAVHHATYKGPSI